MRQRLFIFLIPAFVLVFGTTTQAEPDIRGTLIVIGHSKVKIVVAADSRNLGSIGSVPSDNTCKILPLNSHSIFTAAGFTAHRDLGRVYWDGFKEATNAFNHHSTGSPRILRLAAIEWGNSVAKQINEALKLDKAGIIPMIEQHTFLTGLFMGFENGSTAMYQVMIKFNPRFQRAEEYLEKEKQRPSLYYGGLGRPEIVNEVLNDRTDFAKSEIQKWNVLRRPIPIDDRDVFWAIRLVSIGMTYGINKEEIGGPIDALEITSRGTRWVQRKAECYW